MYTKLFRSMYDGTLCTKGPWQALVTFQQLLILADKYGVVDMTVEAVSRVTTIPLEVIEKGVKELERPDKGSRTVDEEGRRICRLDDHRNWGWRIVNYEKYRQLQRHEERREYMQQYMVNYRKPDETDVNSVNSGKYGKPAVNHSKACKPEKPIAEAILRSKGNTTTPVSSLRSETSALPSSSVLEKQNQIPTPVNNTTRGSRLNIPQLPDDWAEFCRQERPDLDPAVVFESFRDHWKAAAGSRGVKADWLATWRNWVRKETRKPGTDDLQPGAREYLRRHAAEDAAFAAAANITDQEAQDEPF